MSLKPASDGQICPNCGAANSALSIFCAECGTSLGKSDENEEPEDSGQATVSFTPVNDDRDPMVTTWDPAADTQATQEFTPHHPTATATDESGVPSWETDPAFATSYMQRPQESRRGFILGLIGTILIALVIGFFIWSSVVSEGFRDSIIGFF